MYVKLFVIVASLVSISTAVDFCDQKFCSAGKTHVLCTYKKDSIASRCGKVTYRVITEDEKQVIVDLHNELRKKVAEGRETRGLYGRPQPRAKYMPTIYWDEKLAETAQRWSDQCPELLVNRHSECRNTEQLEYVGQNVAWASFTQESTEPTSFPREKLKNLIRSMVEDWYDEVKNYNPQKIHNFVSQKEPAIGHYTQMVWAKTTRIGCGITFRLLENNQYRKKAKYVLVCDYALGGNISNQPVYETY